MSYWALKHLHIACVAISGVGFMLRGFWMLTDSPRLRRRWVRIAPHVVDTLLLASAIGLSLLSQQYPLAHAWLTAKIVGLFVYIAFGSIALRPGRTKRVRAVGFVAALLALGYIVSVALTRDARGPIGWLGT